MSMIPTKTGAGRPRWAWVLPELKGRDSTASAIRVPTIKRGRWWT